MNDPFDDPFDFAQNNASEYYGSFAGSNGIDFINGLQTTNRELFNANIDYARGLKHSGFSSSDISGATGLSIDDINKIY